MLEKHGGIGVRCARARSQSVAGVAVLTAAMLVVWEGCCRHVPQPGPAAVSPEPMGVPAGPKSDGTPYSLTISGGLSLGSYEAGMNWVLVEWLRWQRDTPGKGASPEATLAGVSGASAGAINALFSAIRYCENGTPPSTVDSNLFSKVWRPIGFDTMLPGEEEQYAAPGDGGHWDPDFVISRKSAFAEARRILIKKLQSSSYRRDCEVPISLIVTKVVPGKVELQSLSAKSQRYVVPLIAATVPVNGGHALEFRLNTDLAHTPDQRWVGNLVWLEPSVVRAGFKGRPAERRFVVSAEQVIEALLASSAHPSSFGPVEMAHCVPSRACEKGTLQTQGLSTTCSQLADTLRFPDQENVVACTEPFNDGGAFDNVPLGVAVAQVEQRSWQSGFAPRYVYMDPGQRRPNTDELGHLGPYPGECDGDEAEAARRLARDPVRELTTFVGGFFDAATSRELYTVLRYLEWNTTPAQLVDEVLVLIADVTKVDQSARRKELDALAETLRASEAAGDVAGWNRARLELAAALDLALPCKSTDQDLMAQGEVQQDCRKVYGPERATAIEMMRRRVAAWATSTTSARRLFIPSRFAPITGAMLGHFAAWVDPPFRNVDYYAGVYDGLNAVAEWECPSCDLPERQQRIEAMWKDLAHNQKPGDAATEMMRVLGALEAAAAGHGDIPELGESPEQQILAALMRRGRCAENPAVCLADCSFDGFVAALDDAGYQPETALAAEILSRGQDWWTPLALRVADRLEMLENGLSNPGKGLTWSRRAGSLVAGHWYHGAKDGFSPPSVARHMPWPMFFPYLVFSGNDERKADIGLVGAGYCRRDACLVTDLSLRGGALPAKAGDAPLGPFSPDRGHWSFDIHGGVHFRLTHWALSSLQIRGGYSPPFLAWGPLPNDFSVELDFGLFLDRFRFGFGCNASTSEHGECFDNPYLVIGFSDLTGWFSAIL